MESSKMKKKLPEHAVLVFLQFPKGALDNETKLNTIFDLEDVFREVVERNNVGIFDGNEFCEDTITFFMYGTDADKIYETILPILSYVPFLPGSYILKRYGDDEDSKEEQIFLKVKN